MGSPTRAALEPHPHHASVVLGLSAGFHDSAAALLVDGTVAAAVEEERLSRRKHDAGFPSRAADCCLAIAGLSPRDIDLVAYHEKPLGVVARHVSSRLRSGPRGLPGLFTTTPSVVGHQLGVGRRIDRWFSDRRAAAPPLVMAEHHVSHAAAAFHPSPFEAAAILTVDGVGEWATTAMGEGVGHRIRLDREQRYPDSVGLLYSAFTAYCGFRVNSGEGELMGLAPFGEPRHVEAILDEVVTLHDDGSIRLSPRHFDFLGGRRTTSRRFHDLFGGPPRPLGAAPTRREADLAASIQVVLEEIILALGREAHRSTGHEALCLSGGVALNCVANGRLRREGPFGDVWVQPAASDAGSALGAALWAWHDVLERPRPQPGSDAMAGAFLGPSFSHAEIEQWLAAEGIDHRVVDEDVLDEEVARRLDSGAVVGWFQGRMEFGPRALGHRSILADARSPEAHSRLNGLVKERAGFRPFAPAVLAGRAGEWFESPGDSPYMTFVAPVRDDRRVEPGGAPAADLVTEATRVRSEIPAVTHVDHSSRLQTVDPLTNPELGDLLTAFERLTGCPVLLNTSFNARDEPIVCTPADAHATFQRTGLDLLVLGRCLLEAS